jgi:hypothetical protein
MGEKRERERERHAELECGGNLKVGATGPEQIQSGGNGGVSTGKNTQNWSRVETGEFAEVVEPPVSGCRVPYSTITVYDLIHLSTQLYVSHSLFYQPKF